MGCQTHSDRSAAGTCRSCGHEFCENCLVYAFGEGKQPYCIDCAVSASTQNGWDDRRRVAGGMA
jgi:hypothetical protein